MDYERNYTNLTKNFEIQNITEDFPSIEDVNYEVFIQEKIPVIVYLVIICVTGVIGNIHAIIVYHLSYKPSNHRTLIIALALVDLIACLLCVPFEIFELRFEYTFTLSPICKTFRFLNHVTGTSSGFLLGVIAVERHRKVCRPMGWQISEKKIKIACGVAVFIAVVISIPSFIVYGPTLKKVTEMSELDIYGSDCTVLTKYEESALFKYFVSLLLFLTTLVFIICFVMYVMVGKVIYRQVKFRKQSQSTRVIGSSDEKRIQNGTDNRCNGDERIHPTQDDESSGTESSSNRFVISSTTKTKTINPTRQKKTFNRSKKITVMFLVATGISYSSYVPNIFIVGTKAVNKQFWRELDNSLESFYHILIRSYFISNITNPIVYCFVDDRFRQECVKLYRKLYTRCFRKYTL